MRGTPRRFPDERIIGALQVMAMRLGHTPNSKEWDRRHGRPTGKIVLQRFGSWEKAIAAAGLPQPVYRNRTVKKRAVLEGIRLAHKVLGKWPSEEEYRLAKSELRAAGLPTTNRPAKRLFGTYVEARKAAGGPDRQREGRPRNQPRSRPTSRESDASTRREE